MENKKVVDYYQHLIPQARSIVPHNNLIKTIISSANRDKSNILINMILHYLWMIHLLT